MIEFKRLEMEDFGPYRGTHTFQFTRSDGVWIVYGSNGRGKTSLLNAFRYVLYGDIESRIGKIEPADMVNTLTRKATGGVGRMRVTLEMLVNRKTEWEVTRIYDEDETTSEELLVSVDNNLKTAAQGQRELEAILPPELNDFFLFDGEDLERYEYLLEEESEAGNELRNAIERILGIPTLRQAAAALGEVNSEATKAVAKYLKRDEVTRQAGEALEEAQDILDQHRTSKRKELEETEKVERRLEQVEDKLRQHERSEALMARIDALNDVRDDIKDELDDAKEDFADLTPELWKFVLESSSLQKIKELEEKEDSLSETERESGYAAFVRERLQDDSTECPVCGKRVAQADVEQILSQLPKVDKDTGALADQLAELRSNKRPLQRITSSTVGVQTILDREKRVDKARLQLRQKEAEIKEEEETLDVLGTDEESIRGLRQEQKNCNFRVGQIEDRISKINKKIEKQEAAIAKLREKAERSDSEIDPATQALEHISASMKSLFEAAAEDYRERVRNDVEAKASDIFVEIAPEPEYDRLEINESYGLEILDTEREKIPNRSAGYEHIVALSLLAALQSYSPNQGPIIVDSPFQRLDAEVTELVVGALPKIANQTLLLVFEKQIDREAAHEALGGDLVEEYKLVRESSRETEIETRE